MAGVDRKLQGSNEPANAWVLRDVLLSARLFNTTHSLL